jgi:5-methylcytosine-specific restriction endonuclease McrA
MGVLLLNASYEPLRVINLHRAVVLVLQEKAEIIESDGGQIRSESVSISKPEVIRLKYYVKIPYRSRVPLTNRAVLNRDRYECAYQGQNTFCQGKATTVDHVKPKAKGGRHEWTNVVGSCKKCNSKKADKTLEDLGWALPFVPGPPTAKTWIVVTSAEKLDEWSEWLNSD